MTEPKKLLNADIDKAVTESLEGLVASSPDLQLLDGLPDVSTVLVRSLHLQSVFSPVTMFACRSRSFCNLAPKAPIR